MPLPTTVVDEETATTYVAMPCPHCDGDGVQFVTVEEVAATLDHLGRRYARELATLKDTLAPDQVLSGQAVS